LWAIWLPSLSYPIPCLVCVHAPTLRSRAPVPYNLNLLVKRRVAVSFRQPAVEVWAASPHRRLSPSTSHRGRGRQISPFPRHPGDRCSSSIGRMMFGGDEMVLVAACSPHLHFGLCVLGIPLTLPRRSKMWTEAGRSGTCRQLQG
jgi:hypothetical protein